MSEEQTTRIAELESALKAVRFERDTMRRERDGFASSIQALHSEVERATLERDRALEDRDRALRALGGIDKPYVTPGGHWKP